MVENYRTIYRSTNYTQQTISDVSDPVQAHGPPTPPTTPKSDQHQSAKRATENARQNIDFSNVDISELSSDVIGSMGPFDVREFDQYLPLNGHTDNNAGQHSSPGCFGASYHHHGSVSAWNKASGSPSTSSHNQSSQQRPLIKTEQLSPSHYGESHGSPTQSELSDCPDMQNSTYFTTFSGYPAGIYQYPYFHSSRRSYVTPVLNSLSSPSHSPGANWEQPVYTTLTRPWCHRENHGTLWRMKTFVDTLRCFIMPFLVILTFRFSGNTLQRSHLLTLVNAFANIFVNFSW